MSGELEEEIAIIIITIIHNVIIGICNRPGNRERGDGDIDHIASHLESSSSTKATPQKRSNYEISTTFPTSTVVNSILKTPFPESTTLCGM